jgi:O-antigen ligase
MTEQSVMWWHERLVVALYVAIIALLPFGRLSEIPVLLLAVWGLVVLINNRQRLLQEAHLRTFTLVFAGMMALTVMASVDSLWPAKSWLITLGQLRFYLAGLVLLCHPRAALLLRNISSIVVLVLLFWCLDATIQALWGHNLLGIESYPGRLTGLFGQNVKLGPVLALFLPLILVWVSQLNSWLRWVLVIWVLVIILLSGTRSAWLMAAFVLAIYWWHHVRGRRLLLLAKSLLLTVFGALLMWQFSADFQQRVSRSMQLLQGDQQAIDFALADRLPIWHTAVNMYLAHPYNGVGPRAFRKAYQDHAAADDVWLAHSGKALHAHHWVLEIMAETGTIGLLIMIWLIFRQSKAHWHRFRDPVIWPFGVALLAALLPVVSLYSLFSSFWSICLWWMLMMLNSGVKDE